MFCVFSTNSSTMAAAGAIRRRHSPDGSIQWLASSEALDVLHWAMRPVLHRRIRMVIKIASNLPAFIVVADYLFAHNLS